MFYIAQVEQVSNKIFTHIHKCIQSFCDVYMRTHNDPYGHRNYTYYIVDLQYYAKCIYTCWYIRILPFILK